MEVKDHMPIAYARTLAQSVARYLKKRYGATKVLLFGSLSIGAYNPDFSDIDVGFEGVRQELVASAMEDCRRNFGLRDSGGRIRIDVVNFDALPNETRQQISKTAEQL